MKHREVRKECPRIYGIWIKRADSASRASQGAEPLYIEAGRKLASLKAQYVMRKAEKRVTLRWAAFVKARVGVSKSRANELIQMSESR